MTEFPVHYSSLPNGCDAQEVGRTEGGPSPQDAEHNDRAQEPKTELSLVGVKRDFDCKGSGSWKCHITILSDLPKPFSPKRITGIVHCVDLSFHGFTAALQKITFHKNQTTQVITLAFRMSTETRCQPVGLHCLHLDKKLVKGEASKGPYITGDANSGKFVIDQNTP